MTLTIPSYTNDSPGYVYRITNNINGKWYIGSRRGTVNVEEALSDGYMGSGIYLHRAFEKYDIKNFRKEIIVVSEQVRFTETNILTALDAADDRNSYNMTNDANPPLHQGESHHSKRLKNREIASKNMSRHSNAIYKGRLAYLKKTPYMSDPEMHARIQAVRSETFKNNPSIIENLSRKASANIGIKASRCVPLKCVETGEVFDSRATCAYYLKEDEWQVRKSREYGTTLPITGYHIVVITKDEYLDTPVELRRSFEGIRSQASQEHDNSKEEGSTTIPTGEYIRS